MKESWFSAVKNIAQFALAELLGETPLRLAIKSIMHDGCKHDQLGLTCETLSLRRRHRPQMFQIALVPNQHDDDVGVRMVSQFLEPPSDVGVGRMLGDIIDEESTDCSTVVGRGDCSVSFLTGCSRGGSGET